MHAQDCTYRGPFYLLVNRNAAIKPKFVKAYGFTGARPRFLYLVFWRRIGRARQAPLEHVTALHGGQRGGQRRGRERLRGEAIAVQEEAAAVAGLAATTGRRPSFPLAAEVRWCSSSTTTTTTTATSSRDVRGGLKRRKPCFCANGTASHVRPHRGALYA